MNFARKTRAVVWAIISIMFIALLILIIIANIFDLAQIHWSHYLIAVVCIFATWVASPEDDDEKQIRRSRK